MTPKKKYLYTYKAYTVRGKLIDGQIRAQNAQWARHQIRKQSLHVHSIKKVLQRPFSRHQTLLASDISLFTQQLAMLLQAGIPLSKCFTVLSASCNKNIMKMLLGELSDDIAAGDSFARALRRHPEQFDDLYCNMVESAELSGELASVLTGIAKYQARTEKFKKHLKKALTYPCIVLVVALLVTSILLAKVIPEFALTFSEFGTELPSLTLFVLDLSELFQQFWLMGLLVISLFISCVVIALKHSTKFADLKDKLTLKLPIIGNIVRNANLARFTRILAVTFNAGIPILGALRSAAGTAGNSVFKQSILNLRQDLAHGVSLYLAIRKQTAFPPALKQMIVVGEESGTLGAILIRASGFYEQDLELSLDTLIKIIEPMVMLFLGLLVGGLLLAMYLPIFQISSII